MAIKKRLISSIDVVKAAEIRICNIFSNGLPIYLSFSGGKDSLVLAQLIVNLIQRGKINPSQLIVQFIDEEAIFPCIEKTVQQWRKKFLMLGAKFNWFCLEVRHYNCFNQLENDESFICWDRYKKEVWVRNPPPFAITYHNLLKPRKQTYQEFLTNFSRNGITLIGVRTAESIQRFNNIANIKGSINSNQHFFPIYDWKNDDVWLYLKQQHVEIPNIYLYLYQVGTRKNMLRVSQFFSVDTAKVLVKMNEYYPNLMEKVIKREPNAYLAPLYWDSEMFGRSTSARRKTEGTEIKKDYKAELLKLFSNMERNFPTQHKMGVARAYRKLFLKVGLILTEKDYKQMYEGLISGDPKKRTLRALYTNIYKKYSYTNKGDSK